jgi:hypothetical protein
MLATNIPDHLRQAGNEEAVSVIHAPESFQSWVRLRRFPLRWTIRANKTKTSSEQVVKADQASEKSSHADTNSSSVTEGPFAFKVRHPPCVLQTKLLLIVTCIGKIIRSSDTPYTINRYQTSPIQCRERHTESSGPRRHAQ